MRYLIILAVLFSGITTVYSQDKDKGVKLLQDGMQQNNNDDYNKALQLIKEGVALHDKGDYKEAIKKYQKALSIDKDNIYAMQELTITYTATKEYKKVIEYCDKAIALNRDDDEQIFVNKGTALDLLGRHEDAVYAYKEGIRKHPNTYLLHFNLAITLFQAEEIDEAKKYLRNSLRLNPEHSSSNLILGYANYYQKKNIRASLATYYFLLLEPKGGRADQAHKLLDEMLNMGVSQKDNNTINITMSADRDTTDPFYTASFYLSMLSATQFTGDEKDKTDFEKFYSTTESLVKYLVTTLDTHPDDFYVRSYVNFFAELDKAKHLETFCYWITQTKYKESANWLKKHEKETSAFAAWFQDFTANNPLRNQKPMQVDPSTKKGK